MRGRFHAGAAGIDSSRRGCLLPVNAIIAIAEGIGPDARALMLEPGRSIILEANGKHVLTDSWTSFGVVAGLCLVLLTGWKPFDPLFAIAVALNILWSGAKLLGRSVGGLMDYTDPGVGQTLQQRLDRLCQELGVQYHGVRFRSTGYKIQVELHVLFPFNTPLGARAHDDSRAMRMAAVQHNVPLLTTLSAAAAAINGIAALKAKDLKVRSLQMHFKKQ